MALSARPEQALRQGLRGGMSDDDLFSLTFDGSRRSQISDDRFAQSRITRRVDMAE